MPNGGMMPCCWVCRRGMSHDIEASSVICEQHQLTTYLPFATFCADLALPNSDNERGYSTNDKFKPEPGIMYEWLQVSYQDSKHPGLPQYYHEPTGIALLQEYSKWNKQQQVTTSQARHKHKRQELTNLG
jgi:hypothetical protein